MSCRRRYAYGDRVRTPGMLNWILKKIVQGVAWKIVKKLLKRFFD